MESKEIVQARSHETDHVAMFVVSVKDFSVIENEFGPVILGLLSE